jgi:hypothetical protein
VRIFPVFYNHLPCRKNPEDTGLLGQSMINNIESQHICGRILEREDGKVESVEKWEFEELLDCYNEDSLHYLIK